MVSSRRVELGKCSERSTRHRNNVRVLRRCYDDQGYNFQLYSHDPKIIIGGTNLGPAIENLLTASHQLVKKIDGDVDLSEKAKEKVRKRAAKIDKQIRDLRELLK